MGGWFLKEGHVPFMYLGLSVRANRKKLATWEPFLEYSNLFPMYLSENGDTLVLANDEENEVIIYNCRDNRVEKV